MSAQKTPAGPSRSGCGDLRERARSLPHEPGVYRFLDADGAPLYVGKAKDLRKRVATYFRGAGPASHGRVAEMLDRARDLEWVVTATEAEALLLEDNFIKEHRPPYNLRLRDDKSYPYIEVTLRDEWPRVRLFRGRRREGNLYFGPFSSARRVRETLDVMGRIFPYRKCRGATPGRPSGSPCLQYFIKRSLAPCDGRVSREEYDAVLQQAIDFLRGRLGEVERGIVAQMEAAARAREYEAAALLRDRLDAVRHVRERQTARLEGDASFDVLGVSSAETGGNVQVFRVRDGAVVDRQTFFLENTAGRDEREVLEEFLLEYYWEGAAIPAEIVAPLARGVDVAALLAALRGARVTVRAATRGPKRRLLEMARRNAQAASDAESGRAARRGRDRVEALERLRDVLGLDALPLRMECFDISNLGERYPVGSMVVFEGGLPRKAHYRSFVIAGVEGQDDVAMIGEVVRRRLRHASSASSASAGYDESFARRPDLMVVDGGKGQLAAARAAVRECGMQVPVVSLAKQREEVFVPGRARPLDLPVDDAASLLLQRLRDEAHRFAVSHHRRRRGVEATRSALFDALPGVGAVRRRKILAHFGSPERFLAASRDELERVPGLPAKVARDIYAHLHKAG